MPTTIFGDFDPGPNSGAGAHDDSDLRELFAPLLAAHFAQAPATHPLFRLACESAPREIDTIADLQKLGDVLTARFSDEEIGGILAGNWIRLLRHALSQ